MHSNSSHISQPVSRRGLGLIEVILAILLFVIAATFVLDGLSAAMDAVRRARLESDAADLSVTVMSEVQMGLLEIRNEGPNPFDETVYPGWSWQIEVEDVEDLPDYPLLRRVQIIIMNEDEDYRHRTTQLVWDDPAEETASAEDALEGEEEQPQQLSGPPQQSPNEEGGSGVLPGGTAP